MSITLRRRHHTALYLNAPGEYAVEHYYSAEDGTPSVSYDRFDNVEAALDNFRALIAKDDDTPEVAEARDALAEAEAVRESDLSTPYARVQLAKRALRRAEAAVIRPFAAQILHSDVRPYEVVRTVSTSTLEIREMDAELDPAFKPIMVPGGFAGHTTNSREQKWLYSPRLDAETIRIRLHKDGVWRSAHGDRYRLTDTPQKYHDYNF
jgi:hypothetical protein